LHTELNVKILKYDIKLRIRLDYRGFRGPTERKEWSDVRASNPATTCPAKDSRQQALRRIVRLLEEQIDEPGLC
jgi:hypothetical protein